MARRCGPLAMRLSRSSFYIVLALAWFAFAAWQYRSYSRERFLIRETLHQQAHSVANAADRRHPFAPAPRLVLREPIARHAGRTGESAGCPGGRCGRHGGSSATVGGRDRQAAVT